MCRSIKTLRKEPGVTDQDISAAALQYVRKLSGYRAPSKKNKDVFDPAVLADLLRPRGPRGVTLFGPLMEAFRAEALPSRSKAFPQRTGSPRPRPGSGRGGPCGARR